MSDSSLQQFIAEVSGEDPARVQDDLGNGFVRLKAAEAQRRQAKQDIRSFEDVVIEMLRNARDAHAQAIFVATWATKEQRFLTMLDDGDGIPSELHDTVFEPFVTSKLDTFHSDRWGVHGRGMALYSIRQNTDCSRVVVSAPKMGSVFAVESSFSRLKEKKDQSSAPTVTRDESGSLILRGPHNILRTVLEFSIDERNSVVVYLGTPAEIVSTLFNLGNVAHHLLGSNEDGRSDSKKAPYIQRFSLCEDAPSLAALSNSLSLPMSVRTAYRIMNGEIKPLPTHLQAVLGVPADSGPDRPEPRAHASSRRKISFSREDMEALSRKVKQAYASLADAYYLNDDVQPNVRYLNGELVIRIPIEPDSGEM